MTHLSLFSGIGGLDLAAEWAGFETVGQCEWADYPTKVLERHWPAVARWRDIRSLTVEDFYAKTGLRTVDVVSGGFPCQPFSVAGRRRSTEDDRFLWPEMLRVCAELKPRWVVGENVAGIVSLALDQVCADLEGLGYEVWPAVFPACAVDAPHRRDRVAIVGYAQYDGSPAPALGGKRGKDAGESPQGAVSPVELAGAGRPGGGQDVANASGEGGQSVSARQGRPREAEANVGRGSQDVADALRNGGATGVADSQGGQKGESAKPFDGGDDVGHFSGIIGEGVWSAWERSAAKNVEEGLSGGASRRVRSDDGRPTEPRLGGATDGISRGVDQPDLMRAAWKNGTWEDGIPRLTSERKHRADRLRCLGNAVVPQQFYPVFAAIAAVERGLKNAD